MKALLFKIRDGWKQPDPAIGMNPYRYTIMMVLLVAVFAGIAWALKAAG